VHHARDAHAKHLVDNGDGTFTGTSLGRQQVRSCMRQASLRPDGQRLPEAEVVPVSRPRKCPVLRMLPLHLGPAQGC